MQSNESAFKKTFQRGEHWIWLTGTALAVCLIMISGLLLVVLANGAGYFYPHALTVAHLKDGSKMMGVVVKSESYRKHTGNTNAPIELRDRSQFKVGNRDLYGADFKWVDKQAIEREEVLTTAVALEREEYGDFYGFVTAVERNGEVISEGDEAWSTMTRHLPEARDLVHQRIAIQKGDVGKISRKIQQAELAVKRLEREASQGAQNSAALAEVKAELAAHQEAFETMKVRINELDAESLQYVAVMESVDGKSKKIPFGHIVRAYRPNEMGFVASTSHYLAKVWEFVSAEPRESNTEGGIFPAIFGTVFMTLIMSIAVVPFGVIAAFYLREYAKQGPFVRAVRIAVNNLAGVPSIVFGVFGLGFFVYFVGGTIDQLFFSETLPTPTYGTGGILWASLTLALLTVPVVIVATEESIAAVPRGAKEGSLALGASKFQTICRVVLPASIPGILTGLILAIARGAGEVAPLMITGVVKLAPSLPVDGTFPFLHMDRKFMHMGFHIYDVGFQSPNVEAAKPMVFTTALLLLAVVALLNIVAILVRDKLRKKYKTGAFA